LAALVALARRGRLRPAILLVLLFLGAAPLLHPPARFLLPAVLALALLEGELLARLDAHRAAPLVALIVAIPALVTDAGILLDKRTLAYAAGRIDVRAYLASAVPGWRAADLVNRSAPGGRVMALDFPGPFYFDRPWIVEGILHEPPLQQWLGKDPSADRVLARLRALDVRYIVVTPGYGGGTASSLFPLATSRESAAALVALRSRLRLVGRVDGVDVWAVPTEVGGPPGALYDSGRSEGEAPIRRGGS
jgi:hypothetical protein